MKRVKTQPPQDGSIRFEQIKADGFLMYVEDNITRPDRWVVKFRRMPNRHVDVLWDGHQPGHTAVQPTNAP